MDHGDGYHGVAARGLHAHAYDEFANAEAGGRRKERAFRRVFAFRRSVFSEIAAISPRASPHDSVDLRPNVSFDLRLLSFGGTRLDPCRRPVRADQLLHTARKHVTG